jgi:hypothetical protein
MSCDLSWSSLGFVCDDPKIPDDPACPDVKKCGCSLHTVVKKNETQYCASSDPVTACRTECLSGISGSACSGYRNRGYESDDMCEEVCENICSGKNVPYGRIGDDCWSTKTDCSNDTTYGGVVSCIHKKCVAANTGATEQALCIDGAHNDLRLSTCGYQHQNPAPKPPPHGGPKPHPSGPSGPGPSGPGPSGPGPSGPGPSGPGPSGPNQGGSGKKPPHTNGNFWTRFSKAEKVAFVLAMVGLVLLLGVGVSMVVHKPKRR